MMAGSHVVIGVAAWASLAPHLGAPPLSPVALPLAAAGALLPDIDHPASWVGRRMWPVARPLAAVVGHRGITHSLFAVAACLLVLHHYHVSRAVADPLAVGYLSHLAADLLTPAGLRLTWPSRRRVALAVCRTGSPLECVIVAAVGLAAVLGLR